MRRSPSASERVASAVAQRGVRSKSRSICPWRSPRLHDASAGRLPDAFAVEPCAADADLEKGLQGLETSFASRAAPTVLVANEWLRHGADVAFGRRFRDLQGVLDQRIGARGSRRPHGRGPAARGRRNSNRLMTQGIDKAEAEHHRAEVAKREAGAGCRSRRRDGREGFADRPYRSRQGKVDFGVSARFAHAPSWSRVGVVQFVKGAWHIANTTSTAKFGVIGLAHRGRRLSSERRIAHAMSWRPNGPGRRRAS